MPENQSNVKGLLQQLKSDDENVRTEAWLSAGQYRGRAIKPLAGLFGRMDKQVKRLVKQNAGKDEIAQPLEVGRATKRAMWKIVRTVGAPGAKGKKMTVARLVELLSDEQPVAVRREVLWMLSEIGEGSQVVDPIASLLTNEALREDARMVLERIPGDEAVAALREGMETVPEAFRLNMAQSLRKRGVAVDQQRYPCQKMVPTRETKVKPVEA
jgi:HEAT repeat protein